MTVNQSGWRPEMSADTAIAAPPTATGNRALMLEEALIFEIGDTQRTGVDLPQAPDIASRLGGLERNDAIGLPGLSEQETVRHYTRLSRQNYAIDLGLFPLGSCTMKHNPRLNEKVARMPGFADVHPLAPVATVQGALAVIHELVRRSKRAAMRDPWFWCRKARMAPIRRRRPFAAMRSRIFRQRRRGASILWR